jgi:hypothetical protein
MFNLLEKIGLGENFKFENEAIAEKIINHSQKDYRRLIVTLGELYRIYNSSIITNDNVDNYIKFSCSKDVDRSIYENTIRLFTGYKNINTALKIFDLDKTNMPLMVHQNHFLASNKYIKDKSKEIDVSYDITTSLSYGDIIENNVYSEQNWTSQEISGFYSCVFPSYKLNKMIDMKKLAYDSKNPYYKPAFSSQYPKDLNRTSTRCINRKKLRGC